MPQVAVAPVDKGDQKATPHITRHVHLKKKTPVALSGDLGVGGSKLGVEKGPTEYFLLILGNFPKHRSL